MSKLKFLLMVGIALCATGVAYADDNDTHSEVSEPCPCPCPQPCQCPKPCPCVKDSPEESGSDEGQVVSYNNGSYCDPCCFNPCCQDDCCNFVVFGDWLWWNTRKNELDYAVPVNNSPSESVGHVKHICPDWNSGYRLGFFRDCCDTFFGLQITHFDDKTVSSATDSRGNLGATRLSERSNATGPGMIQYAQARYKVNLDVIDVEGGLHKGVDCDGYYDVFGGLRFAFLDQHLACRYSANLNDPNGLTSNADKVRQKVDMDAYGLYVGGGGYKHLCRRIGIFGRASLGWLVGNVERKIVQKSSASSNPFTTNVNLKDKCYRLVTNLDLALGLQYEFCGFCCNSWIIKVGYEFHNWLNTSDFLDYDQINTGEWQTVDRHSDNLGFDGLFLRLQGDF